MDECKKAFESWEKSFINTPKERKSKWYKSAMNYAEAGWKAAWDYRNKHSDYVPIEARKMPSPYSDSLNPTKPTDDKWLQTDHRHAE